MTSAASGGEVVRYRVMQSGTEVAGVEGPDPAARNDALHYGMMYGLEGLCEVQVRKGRKWITIQLFDWHEGKLRCAVGGM